jgi:hypothetical protein
VLVALAVCLPVPVFAATGLSLPLPATVERLAAALVPWADAASLEADESLSVGADGAIVLARHEIAGVADAEATARPTPLAHAVADRSRTADSDAKRPKKKGGRKAGGTTTGGGTAGTGSGAVDGGSGDGGSTGGTSSGGGSGGGDSGGSSSPVETIVEETGSATQPVVDAVEETVEDPAGTVGGIVEDTGKVAGGLLPVDAP